MKVMLPVINNKSGELKVAPGFHNARNVCIYDSTSKSFELLPTSEINRNIGDFSFELTQRGIESIICCTIQPLVFKIFSINGLRVFKAEGNNLKDNIAYFLNARLNPFLAEDTSQLMGCGSTCNSCSTKCN